jgi:membrane protein implicated in regulation of membrane protease activity
MGGTPKLLEWEYLIYLLPCGLAAFLLLLSTLRLGHHGGHGHGGGHGAMGGHAHVGAPAHAGMSGAHGAHSGAPAHTGHTAGHSGPAAHAGHGHGTSTHGNHDAATDHADGADQRTHPAVRARMGKVEVVRHGPNKENLTITTNFVLHILGVNRAPLLMLIEAFFLVWGMAGFWANQSLLHNANPSLREMLPSLAIALGAGVIGARIAAEVIGRAMPPDESLVVSRNGLFGMTGTVAFPVSATAGRIHIYDEFGTLHDEMCRVASDHPPIEKGHKVLVVDMDTQGRLLVEEIPDSVR